MASINKHPTRFELTAVYHHPRAKADIVFVHGLNGAPAKTWTAANGVYWPTDILPASLKDQHANVLVYGYNADVYGGFWERSAKSPSDNFIHHHAQTLVTTLAHYRKSEGTERNPIIWVAHSLGGIVTKRALLYSHDVRDHHQQDLRSIAVSTYGIIFLGTPHNGSDAAAWGGVIQRMADALVPRKIFESESVLLKSLKKDSETLQQIANHFLDIYQKFKIHMVHENHKTDIKGSKLLVVDTSSASPQLPGVTYYGIEATHSGMCKFESENAPGYRTISTAIREWVADAPNVIPIRWEVEEDMRRVWGNLENFERARLYQGSALVRAAHSQEIVQASNEIPSSHPSPIEAPRSISTPLLTEIAYSEEIREPKLLPPIPEPPRQDDHEPLFIHPETFRPNSYFTGREDELRGLHEMLMDRKRRSEGTSAVLIQCLPGGGKTHLARQYVFQHKGDYPGGVYWVRAKSRHELEYWFWRIARNEALRGLVDQRDVEELRDPKKIIQIVRTWLNSQTDWLVVFDGIQFDTPGLHEFIPDTRNTSLIYTSTERAVAGDPRFDNPQVMELGLLTAQQAQDLLLLEMERKQPWSTDDRAMALELVQLMGRLPLMIHVAAQHLKATREPLARYLKSYRSRPKAGGLPAYKAVREQLETRGENAALNLISLLVFFDQHVPVEMVALGLSALDKVTPVRTFDATHRKASLNSTLKVLIAFALLERSESDDISPTSSRSSTRSFDKHADYLDLLRIHSVVQAFFTDSLQAQHQVHFWLERAVAVWCRSYDEADRRIQEDPRVGLPDDYRRFCIHGQRLLQNVDRFERRYPGLTRARSQVEQRLEKILGQIDQLSHAIQTNIVDGSAEEHPVSVFDRIGTSSQSDATTMESHSSQLSGMGDDLGELAESPMEGLLKPEAPYPITPVMPTVPEITEDDDQETVVLSVSETQVPMGATEPTEAFPPPRDPNHNPREAGPYDDWQDIPHHRAIKRQETRRYHDRAGAWRDKSISDPRVALSCEVAVGSISSKKEASRSPVGSRLTARSEAEMELNKIKLAAPPSRESRGSFGSETSTRPKTLLGRNSWALPQAQKTPDTEVAEILPEEFSSGLSQILSSPKSWTEKTIKMLKKTVLPADKPADTPPRFHPPPEEDLILPPAPIFRGSRSANSSPASNVSPFPPPSFTGIPTDDLLLAAKPQHPVVVRRWDTVVYHPDGSTPISSWGVEFSNTPDPMSLSYPTLLPSAARHHHQSTTAAQHLLGAGPSAPARAPTGYSSQPMSRDGSHESPPHGVAIPIPIRAPSPSPSASPSPDRAQRGYNSPPVGQSAASPSGGAAAARLSPFLPRVRPASYTETEPSPRLTGTPPFGEVDTSYHRWEQQHGLAPGAGAGGGGGNGATGSQRFAHWRPGRGSRILRGGPGNGGKGRRSQSLSPSGSPSGSASASASGSGSRSGSGSVSPLPVPWPLPSPSPQSRGPAPQGPEPGAGYSQHHQHRYNQHQHPLAEWSVPTVESEPSVLVSLDGTGMLSERVGGAPMSRSVSGGSAGAGAGIRMEDGTVVEFGSPGLGSHGPGGSPGRGGGGGRRGSFPGVGGNGLGISG